VLCLESTERVGTLNNGTLPFDDEEGPDLTLPAQGRRKDEDEELTRLLLGQANRARRPLRDTQRALLARGALGAGRCYAQGRLRGALREGRTRFLITLIDIFSGFVFFWVRISSSMVAGRARLLARCAGPEGQHAAAGGHRKVCQIGGYYTN
jgi:hypothetical protein